MLTLAEQIRRRAHVYVAHGGKSNRRQQVDRLVLMVEWMQAQFRLTGLEQIGKRQVIGFWKAHRDMASATAYAYWLAIKVLWQWMGRVEDPPKPKMLMQKQSELNEPIESAATNLNQAAYLTGSC